jgi:26S proteasome regulatory subunit N10
MVLEATMLCLDNSEWARDGDFIPSRWDSQQDAANLITGVKTQQNPENSVGILTFAGPRVEVLAAPTPDVAKILAAIHSAKVQGKPDLHSALQIAQLALKHRQNKQQKQRIVAFVCSPISEDSRKLVNLGKKLKKNNVALDVVCFGDTESATKLQELVNAVNSSDNSHILTIPQGVNVLYDSLVNTPIVHGGEGGMDVNAAGAFDEYGGVDPSVDPELAMVLRMSMEEHRKQQEEISKQQPEARDSAQDQGEAMQVEEDDEKLLQEAIRMSMMEEQAGEAQTQPVEAKIEQKAEQPGEVGAFQDQSYISSVLSGLEGVDINNPEIQEALRKAQEEQKKQEEEKKKPES